MSCIAQAIGRAGDISEHRIHAGGVGAGRFGQARTNAAGGAAFLGRSSQGHCGDCPSGLTQRNAGDHEHRPGGFWSQFIQIRYQRIFRTEHADVGCAGVNIDADGGRIERVGIAMRTGTARLLGNREREIECRVGIVGYGESRDCTGLARRNRRRGGANFSHSQVDLAVNNKRIRGSLGGLRNRTDVVAHRNGVGDGGAGGGRRRRC